MIWYQLNSDELFEALETSEKGLSRAEVSRRINKYGENLLALKKDSIWKIIFEPFKSIFVLVLLLAAAIGLVSGKPLDAVIVGVIILINACIFYTQQYATTRVLRSLKSSSIQKVTVIRDGIEDSVASENLVPGDIIILTEGQRVPADGRVIHEENLQVNESTLTGESIPVYKHSSTLESIKQIYEQDNMVFQGTYVVSGKARVLVVETASSTEFGKIAALASSTDTVSPVQEKIDQLIKLLVKVVGLIALIVFVLSILRGIPFSEALRFVLALTVSVVPEGLPVALTVIIVLGMRRMAKQKALVRSFKAIEDIGLVTTIATDKTGTLTKNHLSVIDSWSIGELDVKQIMGLTIDLKSKLVDPLDQAISDSTTKHHKIDKLFPFDNAVRMSGAYSKVDDLIYLKGSPEHILLMSDISKIDSKKAESVIHEFASNGYRVIAFARYKIKDKLPDDLSDIKHKNIELIGLVAFSDELRPEVVDAIEQAKEAGIMVRLITGDHYETAYNIGKKIGLASHPDQVIQGVDLPKQTSTIASLIQNKTIFARILPEDKFRILKALKQTEITAMTGDGVNDVPALANAHVGIAMGSGSDIARDAGGVVLLDDNFATIIKAVSEGRKIFDNIRRMLYYLFTTALGEVLTMIGALLFGLPLPVTAIQILWINLVTDTAMVLPLGLEPEEDGHMSRPPRRPKDPLLNKVLLSRMIIVGITMAVVTLVIVFILRYQGKSTAYIQTVAFMALIAAQWVNAFNARSEHKSSFSRVKKVNRGMVFGFLIALSLQMLVMFGPLGRVFDIQTVEIQILLLSTGVMILAVLLAAEIHKIITNYKTKTTL